MFPINWQSRYVLILMALSLWTKVKGKISKEKTFPVELSLLKKRLIKFFTSKLRA